MTTFSWSGVFVAAKSGLRSKNGSNEGMFHSAIVNASSILAVFEPFYLIGFPSSDVIL